MQKFQLNSRKIAGKSCSPPGEVNEDKLSRRWSESRHRWLVKEMKARKCGEKDMLILRSIVMRQKCDEGVEIPMSGTGAETKLGKITYVSQ